ncbi:hypothetical protein [Tenacibaculum maritimum]|uniref:hypothetical protein n=2 Tax=Tenacibaculum maritimum TaxID=107401 RepID=UPI003890D78E
MKNNFEFTLLKNIKMTGIITDIFDDDMEVLKGGYLVKKKIVIIVDLFKPNESIAVEFTGELRRKLIRNFKLSDRVEIKYKRRAVKGNGKAYNIITAIEVDKT